MPLIYYSCQCGFSGSRFHRQVKDVPASFECDICGSQAKRQLKAPSSASKVVVDNGFQARAVEVNPEIIEINEKRSDKDYREE